MQIKFKNISKPGTQQKKLRNSVKPTKFHFELLNNQQISNDLISKRADFSLKQFIANQN
jgi:hypothetical protein